MNIQPISIQATPIKNKNVNFEGCPLGPRLLDKPRNMRLTGNRIIDTIKTYPKTLAILSTVVTALTAGGIKMASALQKSNFGRKAEVSIFDNKKGAELSEELINRTTKALHLRRFSPVTNETGIVNERFVCDNDLLKDAVTSGFGVLDETFWKSNPALRNKAIPKQEYNASGAPSGVSFFIPAGHPFRVPKENIGEFLEKARLFHNNAVITSSDAYLIDSLSREPRKGLVK